MNTREILRAIFAGDTHKIDAFLEAGLDVNAKTEGDNWNFLHRALVSVTRAADPSMIEHLVKRGVDVNARDSHMWTPLHFAARLKNVEAMRILLDGGAEIDPINDEGATPLRLTLLSLPLDLGATGFLLSRGANANLEIDGCSVRRLAETLAHGENVGLKDLFRD